MSKSCCGIPDKMLCSCAELLFLHKALKEAELALEDHLCPDDGSIDTRCYPDNHNWSARRALKLIQRK